MKALIVIDAQNEFSANGKRPVPNHLSAIAEIKKHVSEARASNTPIAWVRHFNKPNESPAFVPGTWGASFYDDLGPSGKNEREKEFHKNVYGAFTGSDLGEWLNTFNIDTILVVGFYTHGCVSTTAREAIMRDLQVVLDSHATGACAIKHPALGELTAEEVQRTALLQLTHLGATTVCLYSNYRRTII